MQQTSSVPAAVESPSGWFAAKRYILIALSVLILFFILPAIFGESDKLSHIWDDLVISAMAIAAIAAVAVSWASFPLRSRPSVRRWVGTFFGIALIAQIGGYVVEYTDPNDVGNEYLGFIFIIVALIIAFV